MSDKQTWRQRVSWRRRLAQPSARFGMKDWIGDAVLALLCGVAVVIGSFLPFANDKTVGDMNFSATRGDGISSSFAAGFGWPMLVFGVVVIAVAVAMLLVRPRRHTLYLGMVLSVLGVLVFVQATHASASIRWWSGGDIGLGLGLFVTSLAGILLVPIGIASAMVAWILATQPARLVPPPDEPAGDGA